VKAKGKTESIKRVIDFEKRGSIRFLRTGMLQFLLSKMVFSILIPELKLRGLDLGEDPFSIVKLCLVL